jgi:Tfp pilus assembly protein PilE
MQKINNLIFRRAKGIGLLELMLSLAIIAILLVMATRYYLSASLASDVNEVVSNIQAVEGCLANWRPKKLTDFTLSTCVTNGWFPEASASGDNMVTPWGNATITTSLTDITIAVIAKTNKQAASLYSKLGGDPTKTPPGGLTVTYSIVKQAISS